MANNVELKDILLHLGVEEETATSLLNRMNGIDYLEFTNLVNKDDPSAKTDIVALLKKYNVDIDKVVEQKFVRPISEASTLGARLSGYSNFTTVKDLIAAELVRDWLEQNKVSFVNNDKLTFLVQCQIGQAEELENFIKALSTKSLTNGVTEATGTNTMAKDDLPKQRNPFAAKLSGKTGGGAHASKDPSRKDSWSRKAKHKGKQFDKENSESRDRDSDRVSEGVNGMADVDPLYRLRELAGLRSERELNEEPEVEVEADFEVEDDFDDADDLVLDLGDDSDAEVADEFNDDTLAPEVDVDVLAADPILSDDSEAYTSISAQIDDIRASLGDVKLSEYRGIIVKLDALVGEIRSMGRNYLGEQRKLKK